MAQKTKTDLRREFLPVLEEWRDSFSDEAERRAKLGGYSHDAGVLQALCEAGELYARILIRLIEERE